MEEMSKEAEEERLSLLNLLMECAMFSENSNFVKADIKLKHLSHLASANGDSMQRVATYFIEALAYYQVVKNMRGIPNVLRLSKKISIPDQQLVDKLHYELYPFLKIAHSITNQTIIEAMKQENEIHILDLSACDATQWMHFMLSLRECLPNSTQHVKITFTCVHEESGVLEKIGLDLEQEAERLKFAFDFNPIVSTLENLDLEKLPVKKGKSLAISCVLGLHSLLAIDDDILTSSSMNHRTSFVDMLGKGKQNKNKMINPSPDSALSPLSSSLCPSPKMDCFLNGLWKLRPKVMVITEQECNVNGGSLTERMRNALYYYGSMFDCLDSSFSRSHVWRTRLEKMLLGEQIRNIIACEGVERKERYEKLQTWIPRLELAGFEKVATISNGLVPAMQLLQKQKYVLGYHIVQENKCLFICWNNNPLFSLSAWES